MNFFAKDMIKCKYMQIHFKYSTTALARKIHQHLLPRKTAEGGMGVVEKWEGG